MYVLYCRYKLCVLLSAFHMRDMCADTFNFVVFKDTIIPYFLYRLLRINCENTILGR